MAEAAKKIPIVRGDETERAEALARQAHAELPPPGHERREALRQRDETLQREVERVGQTIVMGSIDPKYMKIDAEIRSRTSYLNVSHPKPGYVYAWVSKNNHNNHRQRLEAIGYETVQGDDPECLELRGTDGRGAGTGTPDTTRQLHDVILMRIKREYYVAYKAREHARTVQAQMASASTLLSMAAPYRNRGITVGPMQGLEESMGSDLRGPRIRPRRYSSQRARYLGLWNNHYMDQHLREGTVPGMEMPA